MLFRTDRMPLAELPKMICKVQVVMGVQMQEVFPEEVLFLSRKG